MFFRCWFLTVESILAYQSEIFTSMPSLIGKNLEAKYYDFKRRGMKKRYSNKTITGNFRKAIKAVELKSS